MSILVETDISDDGRNAAAQIWALATAAREGHELESVEVARPVIDSALGDGESSTLLVARDGSGSVIGFAALRIVPEAAELTYLGVHPHAWGRGVAGTLLAKIDEEIVRAGVGSMHLNVYVDNLPAVRAYERAGWVAVGDPAPHPRTRRLEQTFERTIDV